MRLTEEALRRAGRPKSGQRLLWDDLVQGFGARLTPTRTAFIIQYRAAGGRKIRATLRHWPTVSVDSARTLARNELGRVAARDVEGGSTPLHEAARIWFERVSADWRPRYRQKVDRILGMYLEGLGSDRVTLSPTAAAAIAELGSRPIGAVRRTEVLRVADNIPRGAAEQFLAVLSSCFNWCSEREWIEHNPARNRLRVTGGRRERNRSLNDVELVRLWRTFETEGDPHFGAFQILVLTGARRREVTAMEWCEIDLEAGTWTLPAERRKTGRRDPEPFVIALPPYVVDVVRRQLRLEGSPHVFWGRRDRRPFDFHNALLDRVKKAAGIADWRLHDLRRTMRSGIGRLGISQAVAEMCLGHLAAKGGLVKVYDQHSYENEKREAWLHWAEHVARLTTSG
ncbi:MAG: tyrosine-type recombinase/integrase [Steroidobacteraceae bacterium]